LSARKTVETMKKMRSRKAMSAIDEDGISVAALDFRSRPPDLTLISLNLQQAE
jgi:hypothetical protein